jgi:hypothetical protein
MQKATAEDAVVLSATSEQDPGENGDAFYAVIANGKDLLEVRFEELCSPCRKTLHALLLQVGKKIDGLSPDRKPRKPKAEKVEAKKEVHAQPNGHEPPVTHASASKPAAAGVART